GAAACRGAPDFRPAVGGLAATARFAHSPDGALLLSLAAFRQSGPEFPGMGPARPAMVARAGGVLHAQGPETGADAHAGAKAMAQASPGGGRPGQSHHPRYPRQF